MNPCFKDICPNIANFHFLLQNSNQQTLDRELKCKKCKAVFSSCKGLSIHLVKMHDTSPKIFACMGCFKSYRSAYELKIHQQKVHLNTTKIQCSKCEKTFTSKSSFQVHTKKFHPAVPSIN